LTFARVLAALKPIPAWGLYRCLAAARVRTAAKRAPRLRLELLGEFFLRAAAASTMWIAAFGALLFELVAAILSIVRHRNLHRGISIKAADDVPRAPCQP